MYKVAEAYNMSKEQDLGEIEKKMNRIKEIKERNRKK